MMTLLIAYLLGTALGVSPCHPTGGVEGGCAWGPPGVLGEEVPQGRDGITQGRDGSTLHLLLLHQGAVELQILQLKLRELAKRPGGR